jgi:hypothetical protein
MLGFAELTIRIGITGPIWRKQATPDVAVK